MTQQSSGMETIRDTLLQTLQGVQSGKVSLDQAKAINSLCQTGINAAKVEVDYLHLNKNGQSAFFGNGNAPKLIEQTQPAVQYDTPALSINKHTSPNGGTVTTNGNVTTHKA